MSLRERWDVAIAKGWKIVQRAAILVGAFCAGFIAWGATQGQEAPKWVGILGMVAGGIVAVGAQFTVKKEDKDVK